MDENEPPTLQPSQRRKFHAIPAHRALLLTLTVAFLVSMESVMLVLHDLRLLEKIFCRNYYLEHDPSRVDDDGNVSYGECGVLMIIASAYNVLELQFMCNSICTFIVAIPVGYLADKFGRRVMLMVAIVGLILSRLCFAVFASQHRSIAPFLLLIPSIFILLGGGMSMSRALNYTIISDLFSESSRPLGFTLLRVVEIGGTYIGPLLGGRLYDQGNLLPSMIAVILLLIAGIFVFFIPDTRHQTEPDDSNDNAEPTDEAHEAARNEPFSWKDIFRSFKATVPLLRDWKIQCVLSVIFLETVGYSGDFMKVYYDNYKPALNVAILWLSIAAIVYLVIVPITVGVSKSNHLPHRRIDWMFTSGSLLLIGLGHLIWWAGSRDMNLVYTGIVMLCFGCAWQVFLYSLASSFTSPAAYARLFATISMAISISMPIRELLEQLYNWIQLNLRDRLKVYPLISAITSLLCLVILLLLWKSCNSPEEDTTEEIAEEPAQVDEETPLLSSDA